MPIVGIDHVQVAIPVGGEDVARRFYAGLLGIPETPKPAALARRGGAWFETADVRLHVGAEADFRPARKAHPALLVRDLASLVARLREAGVQVVDNDEIPDRYRVFVHDPFGNRIELVDQPE